jgi:IS30 family transposase
MIGVAAGLKAGPIARGIGRAPSTVTRELLVNPDEYSAGAAMKSAYRRASSRKSGKSKLAGHSPLRSAVVRLLLGKWSPEQVSAKLREEYPDDMTMRISDEAIYDHVYLLPRGELKSSLIKVLRQERKHRRKRRGAEGETRGKIADMLSIEERPAEVADRIIPGHWEGDLVVGKRGGSAVGTLVERTTRHLILVPLKSRDAISVRRGFAKAVQTLPKELKLTLTYDQGKEMAEHKKFTVSTGVKVYFAHPHSPWERGTNENTNGLLRQYFPKGTDFTKITTRELRAAQRSLNGRPRKTLNWKTPQEAFNELLR